MSEALVLVSHLPGEGLAYEGRHPVKPIRCEDPLDYWRGWHEQWSTDATLCGVEHDMEVTDEHIDALLACEHPLCCWAYECHWATTHLPRDVVPFRNGGEFVPHGTEWAEQAAIGFIKIAPEARTGPLEQAIWSQLEYSIERAVRRPYHLHGWDNPVKHHHW